MPSTASRSSRAVLLLALCVAFAAAAAASDAAQVEQTPEQMLEDMKDAIEVPDSIELDGNPGAFADSVDEIEAEDEGVDDLAAKASSKRLRTSPPRKRISGRILRGGCRKNICIGTSTIDLTFIVDGKNFQRWRKFAAKLVNRLSVARYRVRVNMIVAGTKPHMLFDFDSGKSRIVSKILRTRYTSKAGNVGLGEALYFYRKRVLKKGRRFSGKLIMVLTSVDSNSGRSVSKQVSYLTSKGVTFLPVMVGYDVSQEFWKSRATGGKYVWVSKFSNLEFVTDAFLHMRIRWKIHMTMTSVLKCPEPVIYKTPCKHGLRKTMQIGFVKVINKCNPVTKVLKQKSCGCEKGQCFASQAMELILVMQATEDLGEAHFGYEKEFLISMIKKMRIGAKSVRVSVVLFSSRASLAFRLTQYTSQSSVITAVKGLKLLTGKDRAIGDALLMVREQVLTDSAEQSAKMLIVITSGDSNFGRSVEVESARLQEMSVSILVIGVGAEVTDSSLQVISTVYIHIRSWIKLRYAYKYVLRMRISFVAQPAVRGALKIRCPKYRRVLVGKCVAGFKKRIEKFYKIVRNTCMPFKKVHKVKCTKPPVCKEGTKVHVGKCNPKTHIRIVTRVSTLKIRDCSARKKCVLKCSKRLIRKKLSCRKIRCVKRRLTIEKSCSKSGYRHIFWGFYSASSGTCRRVRTKIVRKIPCRGCSTHHMRFFHLTIGRKCTGGSKAVYSSFFASRKGRCSYEKVMITKRRCVLKKRCPRKARIQVDRDCLRKGSRYRGVYWTYLTRLQADGPCVRVMGKLVRLIPCGGCTSEQRSFQQVTIGKACKSGFVTSYVTVYQGEEARTCHKARVVIKKRNCKSCGKDKKKTTPCVRGYRRTYRIHFKTKGGKCVPQKTLIKKIKCGGKVHGCKRPRKVRTRCSSRNKYSYITTYYYEKKKVCTGLVVPPSRTCSKDADLVFVLDSSTSIQDADFAKESRFVQHIVRKMGVSPTGVRVAVVTYSTTPRLVFNLDKYKTKSQVLAAMSKLPRTEGITMTYAAIDLVDSEIYPKRRAGVPFVVVVITDGKSTMGDAVASAEVLKKKGARFVSVGIYNPDPSVTDKINPAELKGISSRGRFWRAGNFNKLESIVGSVTREVCSDMGKSKSKTGGKRVCKTICVKKRRISEKKRCKVPPKDCSSKTVIRHCKKNHAYRVFTRVTYRWNGKKCVPKSRKVIKKLPCPPKPCPKSKTIRTRCKSGASKRTTTFVFYVSKVRCTKRLPPRCTQVCIKKVKIATVPCKKIVCKRDHVNVTKCGDKRRYRVVVTTKYRRVGGVCKKSVRTKRYPCPVKCPKTQVIRKPCRKGSKFSFESTITYTTRRSCVLKGKCTVKCVRRVLRLRKKCVIRPPDRRCKQPPPYWTKCKKYSAYKYKIRVYYKSVRGTCVIVRRETKARLLCPPRRCPKSKRVVHRCVKGAKHRITTTTFYSGKIVCSKKKPVVCRQVCTRRVTRSAVPCDTPIPCDKAKKVKVTKCGGKRRYRSVITTWHTGSGKTCKKRRVVKHYPCPVTCPKSKTIKRTSCGKGKKYRTVTIATSTVRKVCKKSICTLHCVKKLIHSRVSCPKPPSVRCKKSYKVHTRCSKKNKYSYTTTYYYERKRLCLRNPKSKKRQCKTTCVKKHKRSPRKPCRKPPTCRFELSYHTSKCVRNFRTITAKYRTLIRGRCVWRSKVVRRVLCPGCSSYQNHFHKTTVGTKCKAGYTQTYLNFYESRKFKTGWVCHKKQVKVSIVKCKCNKKPLYLIDKKCHKGYRKATKVVFYDRGGVCVRKQTVTKIKCPPVKCFNKKVLRKCRKDSAFQYVVRVYYKPVGSRCISYKSRIIKKVTCPPIACPKSKKIVKRCSKGVRDRVTTTIFYVGKVYCTKSRPRVCRQKCIRKVTRSAVPCTAPGHCVRRKRVHVTKCGGKRRYRSVKTTWFTGKYPKCKKHQTVKHFPCPVVCKKPKEVKIPCVGSRKFRESRIISYSVKKSCRKSVCVLRCVKNVVVSRVPCKAPVVCRPRKRVLPCSKRSAYRKIIQRLYKFKKGKCRIYRERVLKKIPCPCKRGRTVTEKTCYEGFRKVVKTVYIRVRGVCRAKSIVLRRIRCKEPLRCTRNYYLVSSCFHGVRRLLYVSSRRVKSASGRYTCVSRSTAVAYFDCLPDCKHGVQKKLVLGCKCVRSQRSLYQITFTASRSKCSHSVKLMGKVSCNDCLSYLKRWKHWMLRLKVKKPKKIIKVSKPKKVIKHKKTKKDRRALLGFSFAG